MTQTSVIQSYQMASKDSENCAKVVCFVINSSFLPFFFGA